MEWGYALAAAIPLAALVIAVASFLRSGSSQYTNQLEIRIKDGDERFKSCHEERRQLERENKRLREQLLELMLDAMERPDRP